MEVRTPVLYGLRQEASRFLSPRNRPFKFVAGEARRGAARTTRRSTAARSLELCRRDGRRVGLLLVALVLAGCTHYQARPVSPSASAAALESRSLEDPRLAQFIKAALPPDENGSAVSVWDLRKLTLAALYYHPDIDVARARLASRKAGLISAGQIPNPTFNLGLTYNSTTAIPSPWTVGAMVSFLLETYGRRQYRTEQARELLEATRYDLETASWRVRDRVRTALLELWASRRRLALNKEQLALQEQLVALLEQRLAAGAASALDVTRERIHRNEIDLAVRDAEGRAAEARARLAGAIGIPLRALHGVKLSFNVFDASAKLSPDVATGDLRRQALLSRFDIQSVLADYAATQSALQLEIARQYPNLELGPGYSYDQGDNKYSLSLSLQPPLFNQHEGPIAQAEAHREEVAARFTALQAQIINAIDAASTSYYSASHSLSKAQSVVAEEQRRQNRMLQLFKAGDIDRTEWVAAELQLTAAKTSLFEAIVRQRLAMGLLEDALQHPLLEREEPLPALEHNPRLASEPAS